MICFCSNAECQTCPKFDIYHFEVRFVVAVNSKRRKAISKIVSSSPNFGAT